MHPRRRPLRQTLKLVTLCGLVLLGASCSADSDSESDSVGTPDGTGSTDCSGMTGSGACADMVRIAAGAVLMGSPAGEGTSREHPQHLVTVEAAFWLDRTEVSTAQFLEFVREEGNVCTAQGQEFPCFECFEFSEQDLGFECTEPGYPLRNNCQASPGGPATSSCGDHPMVLVTWAGARAYCAWRGKRLPSEAEWELAANGPADASGSPWRRFPWGDDCPASWNADGELAACAGDEWTQSTARANCEEASCHDGFEKTAPVGYFTAGASPSGALDLAGNVLERVEDCYHPTFDGAPTDGSAWLDGCTSDARVARSSSHIDPGVALRGRARTDDIPLEAADPDVGFRCARDLSP